MTGSALHASADKECPICGSRKSTPVYSLSRYQLSCCPVCTHSFISSGLAANELDQAYERDYYVAEESGGRTGYENYLSNAVKRERGFAHQLHELERFAPQRGRLLDFGCAVGLFVKVAVDAGWDAIGLERSDWAADYGRRQYGLTILSGSEAECAGFSQRFDMVTMWDVLEHVEEPRRVIEQAAGWLRPGGILALNTVDSASLGARLAGRHWRHLAPPHHLQYFTRRSLQRLLRGAGFHLLNVRSRGVFWLADKRRNQLQGLRALSEGLFTHWRAQPLADFLHLLDEIEIVARLDH